MATMTKRLQVLIDSDRYARLEQEARRRQVSVAALVREAVDRSFPTAEFDRAAAARRLLDAEPIEVDDWPVLKREIEEMYGRGLP